MPFCSCATRLAPRCVKRAGSCRANCSALGSGGGGPGPPRRSVPSSKGREGRTEVSGTGGRNLGRKGCNAEVAHGTDEAGSQTGRVLDRTAEQGCRFAQALDRQELGTQTEVSQDTTPPELESKRSQTFGA